MWVMFSLSWSDTTRVCSIPVMLLGQSQGGPRVFEEYSLPKSQGATLNIECNRCSIYKYLSAPRSNVRTYGNILLVDLV